MPTACSRRRLLAANDARSTNVSHTVVKTRWWKRGTHAATKRRGHWRAYSPTKRALFLGSGRTHNGAHITTRPQCVDHGMTMGECCWCTNLDLLLGMPSWTLYIGIIQPVLRVTTALPCNASVLQGSISFRVGIAKHILSRHVQSPWSAFYRGTLVQKVVSVY
jgi:hypothetical protein